MFDLSNYAFNLHAIPILITGVIPLVLGFVAYFSNRTAAANRHFLVLCISTSVWLCATGIGLLSQDPESAFRWFKLDNIGVMYISISFYAFSAAFLELRRPLSRTQDRKLLRCGSCPLNPLVWIASCFPAGS